ncbi:hypothetical protein [Rufibacter immobilis]|uniref:hypothetical protein n=1 Tax=Rufibacter immobilis TaxID=1348778 RepID=UPI0035EEBB50
MSTRSADQQKKQRQKEFKERKENQERLKAAAKNALRKTSEKAKDDEVNSSDHTAD